MQRKRHYRQLVLFIVVLIIPSVLLTVVGWSNVALVSAKRLSDAATNAAEAYQRARTEMVREIWDQLETVKRQIESGADSDPLVAFAGWQVDGKLVMPWEKDPNAELFQNAIDESTFAASIDEAERALWKRNGDRAAEIYRKVIRTVGDERQRAFARRKLSAVLRRSGSEADRAEADSFYRDLLSLPSSLVDNDGLSMASLAALALADTAGDDVLTRVEGDLNSLSAMTLDQAYRWRSVVQDVAAHRNPALHAAAESALARLTTRIAFLERARNDLEKDADFAAFRKEFRNLAVNERSWQRYGNNLRVSRTPDGVALRSWVVAVRFDKVLEAAGRQAHAEPPVVAVGGDAGEPLDEDRLPGLRASSVAPPIAPDNGGYGLLFYAFLLLVASLNILGGYLLWRDTRREVRLAELRSQFVSSVSHELKTPLTAIRMFGEILQTETAVDPKTHDECVDTIVNESERLTRLLNNVLDFSRIEHDQKTYRLEPTCLCEVLAAATKTLRYPLEEQGFALNMAVDERMPPVPADRDAIKQAVLNLLTNAMKYSGENRNIGLRLVQENGHALIQVTDHGIGIPVGEQSRIFDKFYRARVHENQSISGTGLGLTIVMHVAEGHGGSVQVESSPGAGSTFSIRIPAVAGGVR